MPLILRDATEADLPAITAITNDAILHTTALWTIAPATEATRRAWMAERRAAGFPVIVIEASGAVTGFGSYGSFRPHDGYLHTVEHSLYVDAAARGGGLGRAILAALLDHATAAGRHVMIGGIEAGNAASIALHRRFGFTETGRLPEVGRKFDRWLDLVLMQKMLSRTP